METFWKNLKLVCEDQSVLNRTVYISMYSEMYNYILTLGKNDVEYNINYYDYIIENTNSIILESIFYIEIDSLEEYNNQFFKFNELIKKLDNVYEYFNKQIKLYNNYIFSVSKKEFFIKNCFSLWNKFILNNPATLKILKKELIDDNLNVRKQYFSDLNNEEYTNKFVNLFQVQDFLKNCDNNIKYILLDDLEKIVVNFYEDYFNKKYSKIDDVLLSKLNDLIVLEDEIFCFSNIFINISPLIQKILMSKIDIIYKTIYDSVTQNDIKCFKTIYNYLKLEHLEVILFIYDKYLDVQKNIFTVLDSANSIINFCNFFKNAYRLLIEAFEYDPQIKEILNEVSHEILNKSSYFSEQYGNYFNKLMDSDKIEKHHIILLKYLNNTETFQIQLLNNIKKHIIRNYCKLTDTYISTIENIIKLISEFEGIDITFKLKKFLEDIDYSNNFNTVMNYNTDMNILIITEGIWNLSSKKIEFKESNLVNIKPQKLKILESEVREMYDTIYDHRQLNMCDNYHTNEIEFYINNQTYTIIAPLNITLILIYFNDNKSLSEQTIKDEKLYIEPLLKHKIVVKQNDSYIINENFKSKNKIISILSKPKKKKKKLDNLYDHNLLVESAIVKIMKRHETLQKQDLFNEVQSFLKKKIKINDDIYNKNLNKLEKNEYIEITEEDKIVYIP